MTVVKKPRKAPSFTTTKPERNKQVINANKFQALSGTVSNESPDTTITNDDQIPVTNALIVPIIAVVNQGNNTTTTSNSKKVTAKSVEIHGPAQKNSKNSQNAGPTTEP